MTALFPTPDQKQALTKIMTWLTEEKSAPQFLLEGYAGCGKTTLVNFILAAIKNSTVLSKKYESIYLTATTNKAVDALRENINLSAVTDTVTIHTFLNLLPFHSISKIYETYLYRYELYFGLHCVPMAGNVTENQISILQNHSSSTSPTSGIIYPYNASVSEII